MMLLAMMMMMMMISFANVTLMSPMVSVQTGARVQFPISVSRSNLSSSKEKRKTLMENKARARPQKTKELTVQLRAQMPFKGLSSPECTKCRGFSAIAIAIL